MIVDEGAIDALKKRMLEGLQPDHIGHPGNSAGFVSGRFVQRHPNAFLEQVPRCFVGKSPRDPDFVDEPGSIRGKAGISIDDVKVGDVLYPDGGFTCMAKNDPKVVKATPAGELYVECAEGMHMLDGQANAACEYVGLAPFPWE